MWKIQNFLQPWWKVAHRHRIIKIPSFWCILEVKIQTFLQPWWRMARRIIKLFSGTFSRWRVAHRIVKNPSFWRILEATEFKLFLKIGEEINMKIPQKSQGNFSILIRENLEKSGKTRFSKSWQPWSWSHNKVLIEYVE